ncbi:MAG: aspartate carbamoyltransferase regulatory subunit [Candidatus Thermoplasmatota archaeon]|nr:aspartate carbamoyltransferase regulatory subunit [Candidatus Thermoplasmatota archaeon]
MEELKVQPIKEGTVIDHIAPGTALKVLSILGLSKSPTATVSLLMNVPSKKYGKKDIVKIEARELKPKEVDKIALIAPNATINIIRNYKVKDKYKVKLSEIIIGIVRCSNPSCISNLREPVESKFSVISRKPLKLRCYYCERELTDIIENIVI